MTNDGFHDAHGRLISLRPIGDDWREVADLAPHDDQRRFVAALAARYLLLSDRGGTWHSLAVYADETVVGHIMWARDDDGSHWIGGVLVNAPEQGTGIGRAMTETMIAWLRQKPENPVIRLSYHPENLAADGLYRKLGFVPTGAMEDDEIVVELGA